MNAREMAKLLTICDVDVKETIKKYADLSGDDEFLPIYVSGVMVQQVRSMPMPTRKKILEHLCRECLREDYNAPL